MSLKGIRRRLTSNLGEVGGLAKTPKKVGGGVSACDTNHTPNPEKGQNSCTSQIEGRNAEMWEEKAGLARLEGRVSKHPEFLACKKKRLVKKGMIYWGKTTGQGHGKAVTAKQLLIFTCARSFFEVIHLFRKL